MDSENQWLKSYHKIGFPTIPHHNLAVALKLVFIRLSAARKRPEKNTIPQLQLDPILAWLFGRLQASLAGQNILEIRFIVVFD